MFGSATSDRFDPETSDLDFLVEYEKDARGVRFRDHFGLKFELEALFGRDVDLIEDGASKNPYFLKSIAKDRVVLYAA